MKTLVCLLSLATALCAPLFAQQKDLSARSADMMGTVFIEADVTVTAVATEPNATTREKLAADELAAYLEKISGKKLKRIEAAGRQVPGSVIAVGNLARQAGLISTEELGAVGRDGYVLRVAGGRAGICGARDVGTVYGAYALLRHLGVKFYALHCEIVPKVRKLVIPNCKLREKPFYEFRSLTGNLKLGHTPKDDMGNPGEIGERGSLVHSAAYLLPFDKFSHEHPEYFALQKDGKRLHRDPKRKRFDVHLCLSNPDVRRISAQRMLELIEKQPEGNYVAVRPSGTEPKVKFYMFAYDPPKASADLHAAKATQAERLAAMEEDLRAFFGQAEQ